jgi:hypothetical protein
MASRRSRRGEWIFDQFGEGDLPESGKDVDMIP